MYSEVYGTEIKIDYNQVDGFNRYPSDIMAEYNQCIEEGLDIEKQKALFESVAAMENGEMKTKVMERMDWMTCRSAYDRSLPRSCTLPCDCL